MSRSKTCLRVLLIFLAVGGAAFLCRGVLRRPAAAVVQRVKGHATVEERLEQFGAAARSRMAHDFDRLAAPYPPKRVVLVGLKQEKRLEVWVSADTGPLKHLKTYPILGASGTLGPKLREGDRQVPEGVYRIESLNPNSLYHVALRVDYPNALDRAKGAEDGRANLGGDIMIHGKTCSIGCLAMGDAAAEELFVLAAEAGLPAVSAILSPVDFRVRDLPPDIPKGPAWAPELYATIRDALSELGQDEYTASKHALAGLTKSLAVEAQPHGIRVSLIRPGGVDTEMVERSRPDLDRRALLHPDDVAQAVIYLLSLSDRAAVDEIYIRRRASSPF